MATSISTVVVAATIMGLGAVASAQEACEPQRLTSPLGAQALIYGYDVVTNGTHWFVAESAARTPCATGLCQTGAVHVYEMVEDRLVHTQTIVPHDAQSFQSFGRSIAADGNRLVVGSPSAPWGGRAWWPGVAYVYEHDGEQWVETDRIGPPDEVIQKFGVVVHVYGHEILVRDEFDRLYRYIHGPEGWTPSGVLAWDPTMLTFATGFGIRTASNEDWLFVAAYVDDSVLLNGGSVHVFRRGPDNSLELVQILLLYEEARFGHGLAFDGTLLYVGAPLLMNDVRFQGGVIIHEFDGSLWHETQRLFVREPGSRGGFGTTVVVEGDRMVLTADRQFSGTARGTTYLFRRNADGQWFEDRRLIPNPPSPVSLGFGWKLALSQGRLLASSHDENAAYLFDLTCFDCKPDLDGDGALTIFDYLAFQTAFGTGDLRADFDGDGELTIFDFLAFQTAFAEGCE
ncbi:MAG: hypothetical protein KIT54_01210 [Phycisphaeraceae bacterium]|nr:hypothetical protein [Phycisphaeraceae bacterium]